MVLKFIVTSGNPTKISAVKRALSKFHDSNEFVISSFPADSGVSDLPKSDVECIQGGKNRINFVLNNSDNLEDVAYIVGIEGGLDIRPEGMFICTWVVIYNLNLKTYTYGCSPKIILPSFTYEPILNGVCLTNVLRCIADCDDFKRKNGVFGILTKNLLTREESTNLAFLCAYSFFVHSELFNK